MKHVAAIRSRQAWIASLALPLSFPVVTADYKTFAGTTADVWQAFDMICVVVSLGWLGYTLVKMKAAISVDDLINTITKDWE